MSVAPVAGTAFEPIVAASDIERELVDLVQLWMRDYLAEIDRQQGQPVGSLPMPRSWVTTSDIEKMPEDQTPALIVSSSGTTDAPSAGGDGRYVGRWRVELSVLVSARGSTLALRLARLYAAAVRALFLQQQGGKTLSLRRIDWMGERYDALPSIDDRTLCIGTVDVAVEIADVTTRHAGPLAPILGPDPDPDPESPQWPTSQTADVVVHKESLT
jgi:hypothetical protein